MTQMFQTHTLTPMADAVPVQRLCRHCQSKLDAQLADEFCCHGCRSAYELIESFELKRFYEIVQGNRDTLRPAGPQNLDYRLFDAAEFQEGFVEQSQTGQQTAHFYLTMTLINIGILGVAVGTRSDLQLTVLRQPKTTYTLMDEIHVGNYFSIRVVNRSRDAHPLTVQTDPEVRLICSLCNQQLPPDAEEQGNLVLIVPVTYMKSEVELNFGDTKVILPILKPGKTT